MTILITENKTFNELNGNSRSRDDESIGRERESIVDIKFLSQGYVTTGLPLDFSQIKKFKNTYILDIINNTEPGGSKFPQYEIGKDSSFNKLLFFDESGSELTGGAQAPNAYLYLDNGNIIATSADTNNILLYETVGASNENFTTRKDNIFDFVIGSNGNLFVAAENDPVIKEYDGVTGEFVGNFTFGSDVDQFTALAFGNNGHLYAINDTFRTISEFQGLNGHNPGKFQGIVAENNSFNVPRSMAFDEDSNLYIANTGDDEVIVYDKDFNEQSSYTGNMNIPLGLTISPTGTLMVCDSQGTGEVQEFQSQSGNNPGNHIGVFTSGGGLVNAQNLDYGPDGNLYVCDVNSAQVYEFNGTTGVFIGNFIDDTSGLEDTSSAVKWNDTNDLYISSGTNKVIKKVHHAQEGVGQWNSGADSLSIPNDLVRGPDGNVYTCSNGNDSVKQYDQDGVFQSTFVTTGSGGLDGPVNLVFGPDDNLYVTSIITNTILRYDGSTGAFIDTFVNAAQGLSAPTSILFNDNGDLIVSDTGLNHIDKIGGPNSSAPGIFIETLIEEGSGGLTNPRGIRLDSEGFLYVCDGLGDQVLRYNGETGEFINIFTDRGINDPIFINFDSDNLCHVVSEIDNTVKQFNTGNGVFTGVLSGGGTSLTDFTITAKIRGF